MKNQAAIIEEVYEGWLTNLFDVFFTASLDGFQEALHRMQNGLAHAIKCRDILLALGEKLTITFKENEMAAKVKVKMGPKSNKPGPQAVMPPVKWSTLTAGLALGLVDASGAPVGPVDPTTVVTTMTALDPATQAPSTLVTIAAGADSMSYTISKAAGVTGNIVLNATLTYNAGTPGPFAASMAIELDTPGPADLTITISGN